MNIFVGIMCVVVVGFVAWLMWFDGRNSDK